MIKLFNFGFFIFLLCFTAFSSCGEIRQARFPVTGTGEVLFAKDRAAQEGTLDFSKTGRMDYWFSDSFVVPPNSSLKIEFGFISSQVITENYSLFLNMGAVSWELPMDVGIVSYSVPIEDSFDGHFSIAAESTGEIKTNEAPVFQIHSIEFVDRWFGFYHDGMNLNTTPFVHKTQDERYVIDIPAAFRPAGQLAEIEAVFSSGGRAVIEFAGQRIETLPGAGLLYIPPILYSGTGEAVLSGDKIESFRLNVLKAPLVFPQPIKADPALVLVWPREKWRNPRYEVFRWDRFPSLLIFDFADYNVQNRMLKRLAFYVEKAGFRGRLAHDEEIANLHGWNAHDYRALDLARFFTAARRENFPLLNEERELERILLNEGIIREGQGGFTAGEGAIISITREAPDYLRYRFMAHEGFHGLFFIDEDFHDFSRRRWEQFSPVGKRFLISFFDYQAYDTEDDFLVVKEFNSHLLQQSLSQAPDYFGRSLPVRLENAGRGSQLPPQDTSSRYWTYLADTFTREAQVFSDYVYQRWGLAAGRVWSLRVR